MEKIGIIGSGNMGKALGLRLAQVGHSVFLGARDIIKAAAVAAQARESALSGTVDDAVAFGDVLLWTMREADPAKVLERPEMLAGKIIMDLNNRDYASEARTGSWFGEAFAERLQQNASKSKVVKVFNTLAMESFDIDAEALLAAGAQTFVAGSDEDAKQRVTAIAKTLGLTAIDLGPTPASYRAGEALGDIIRLLMIDGKRGGSAHLKLIALPQPNLGVIGQRNPSNYA